MASRSSQVSATGVPLSVAAFRAIPILQRVPVEITSIETWKDRETGKHRLAIGTKKGVLITYSIVPGDSPENTKIQLLDTIKGFSKKPVPQIHVNASKNVLIATCDNMVTVHKLNRLNARLQVLKKTKVTEYFAVDARPSLVLAVACKKRIIIYNHTGEQFVENQECPLPDTPRRGILWADNSLFLAFDTHYGMLDIAKKRLQRVWDVQKHTSPLITLIPGEQLAMSMENKSVFVNFKGEKTKDFALNWTSRPLAIRYCFPYVLGVMAHGLEVGALFGNHSIVQNIQLRQLRFVTPRSGCIVIASAHFAWLIHMLPMKEQLEEMIRICSYEDALALCNTMQWPNDKDGEERKRTKLAEISKLNGCQLFANGKHDRAMRIFERMRISPLWVIGLIPLLLPHKLRNRLRYPSAIVNNKLDQVTFIPALSALASYLQTARANLRRYAAPELQPPSADEIPNKGSKDDYGIIMPGANGAPAPGTEEAKKAPWADCRDLAVIVDTVLLKAYLHTDPSRITPLVDGSRGPNYCHIDECKKTLVHKQQDKYLELILLYQSNGMHVEALVLLDRLGQDERPSPLRGPVATSNYLRSLGREHIDLIYYYSRWVLESYPQVGLPIFTEPRAPKDKLPARDVLRHLRSVNTALTIPYLEYLIHKEGDTDPEFHDELALSYLEAVSQLLKRSEADQDRGKKEADRRSEVENVLANTRKKLMEFLQKSPHYYNPQRMLTNLPKNELYEERAVLLSKIGKHRDALEIYVHKLNDLQSPLKYCERVYAENDTENAKDVYYALLLVYLRPESGKPRRKLALNLLIENHSRIDLPKALALLPEDETSIKTLEVYLRSVLRDCTRRRRNSQIVRHLVKSESVQVRANLVRARSQVVRITEDRLCPVCNKRLGNAVFSRYPNGVVVHYYCATDKTVCPISGVKFSASKDTSDDKPAAAVRHHPSRNSNEHTRDTLSTTTTSSRSARPQNLHRTRSSRSSDYSF